MLALLVVAVAITVAVASGGSSRHPARAAAVAPSGAVLLRAGKHTATLDPGVYLRAGAPDHAALASAVRRLVPAQSVENIGPARITYRYDRVTAVSLVAGLGARGGSVTVPRTAIASLIHAPVVQQQLQNDCEATALQILLATLGRHADQHQLQNEMPRSGPLDPTGSGDGRVWGDPELGFVGRPDGGGPAGGFGVYQRPVRRLAARHGVALRDLTGSPPARIFSALLAGHAVLAWVGLSDGPFSSWRSPTGRPVTINYGEHALVLTGLSSSGTLTVDNPLTGVLETWTKAEFLSKWKLLGTRALSV